MVDPEASVSRLARLVRSVPVCLAAVALAGFVEVGRGTAAAATAPSPNSVTSHGAVPALGPAGGLPSSQPVVGVAATPDGGGYWLVASDGGVFAFGDARFSGSMGGVHLSQPVVGMAATPDGGGYWLVASDGGVFAFGDARFSGSMGGVHLNQPVVGMASPDGGGYWLVASDGGVFAFGDARFYGSDAGLGGAPTVAVAGRPEGYWLVHGAAGIQVGLASGASGPAVTALQQRLQGLGYWLGSADGAFGPLTLQAVYAFQKENGLVPTGVVDLATSQALGRAGRPSTTAAGDLIEVDKGRQVLLVIRGGRVLWAFNTSTGMSAAWVTPDGRWAVYRQVDGYDVSPLGVLYRPKYVVGGIAIHGYPSVPPYPASHGCIRVTDAAMDFLWSSGLAPIGEVVWIHG